MYSSNKIVVVGGGSSGWMSAATLIRFFPYKDITVIESANTPIIGVGESTLGHFTYFLHALGIDEKDLFKYADASYKLSIKFTDFYKKDYGSFHYPFGRVHESEELFGNEGLKAWYYKKLFYPETPVEDYCRTYYPAMPLIENNKLFKNEDNSLDGFIFEHSSAFHFDAVKFGIYLRDKYCVPRGVKHIVSEVKDVKVGENGVEELTLEDGSTISADLYIDCTGWKSLLLGQALGEEFISYEHLIPNNKAWATKIQYVDKEKEMEPYTNCTAIGNGWVWNIPLWNRIGTGYVYSDKYIDKEEALKEFKQHLKSDKLAVQRDDDFDPDELEYKDISMRIGIHKRTWVKNVVAIGLAAGFVEPLESTGLLTVHEFLLKLVRSLEKDNFNRFDIDAYNLLTNSQYDGMCKFVSLHYALSNRDDTQYWLDVTRNRSYIGDLMGEELIYSTGTVQDVVSKLFIRHEQTERQGMHCICPGMNYSVFDYQNIMNGQFYNYLPPTEIMKNAIDHMIPKWKEKQRYWQRIADKAPTLYEYVKNNFHNGKDE
jgi:tryptophan halogenase